MSTEEVCLRFLPYNPAPDYLLPPSLHLVRRCDRMEEAIRPGRSVSQARKAFERRLLRHPRGTSAG